MSRNGVSFPAAPRPSRTSRARRPTSCLGLLVTLISTAAPALPFLVPLTIAPEAAANEDHPRWKEFVQWLMDKKRTPHEDLILRFILSGGSRFGWLDVYAHSMQEQTEALFRRWLDGYGNPRPNTNLGTRAGGDGRR